MDSGDVLGMGLVRLALAICLLLAVMLLTPAGMTWVGVSAILGAIEGLAAAPIAASV